jgi:hypothetical protein
MLPAALIRALDTLRENKIVESQVAKLRKTDAGLNAILDGRSNNSLNASGNSLDVIREIEGFSQSFPPR